MSQPRDERQDDLFQPPLEKIINLGHPLVRMAREIDWDFLAKRFSSVCRVGPGQPPLPTRLVAGLLILKHMHNLSDEALCDRWVENPYFQYFCGEVVFRHELPFDRSSLTRWRQRLGEEQIAALLQESLSVAHRSGAIESKDLERGVVDTTVQEKAIAHPTDARLTHRAIEKLVDLAKREGVELRQSYLRVAKRAAIMVGALYPCASVQARQARAQIPANPSRPHHSRHPPQDRGQPGAGGTLRSAARSRRSASADPRSILCMRPRSNVSAKARPARLTSSAANPSPPHGNPYDGHTLGPRHQRPAGTDRH